MTTNEIRNKFLKFFESKGHTIVASDSLVPKNDPTVLFTTAGMQQFKRQFLGHIEEYSKAATSQKCLRTDDLGEVGTTNFHHTFFEMLGNFSFGDYFKKEAILWSWEFLTKELSIPQEKLWVSVYKDDFEAESIWLNDIKLPKDRLLKLGDKSNFWPANAKQNGPNGPCGPCSEIFFDYGKNPECTAKVCDPDCDCGRFSEIWNLVFTQFDRKDKSVLEPLPNKNIDTGMGLERLAAVLQNKKSNFDIDIFQPIFTAIDHEITNNDQMTLREQRLIADHIRAIVFGIADGVVPSNEGRGYVIKKLIIDITDIALRSGSKNAGIHKIVPGVIKAMKEPYPELIEMEKDIIGIVAQVEKSYLKTRKERLPEFEKKLKNIIRSGEDEGKQIGELLFTYRDTFGLTIETMFTVIKNCGINESVIKISESKFSQLMQEQQKKSRSSSKMTGDVFANKELNLNMPKTDFLGYEHGRTTSSILKLFMNDEKVDIVKKGDTIKIILDKSPFYAESGGQVGDSGLISNEQGEMEITDTQKIDDIIIHTGVVKKGHFKTDDLVTAEIDVDRRLSIMRNHTATHLLQAAMREIIGTHVKQQGSYVCEDRLRFDFTHHQAITEKEINKLEEMVNMFIRACDTITTEYLPIEQAKKSGALAFFAEKYGSTVRVVSIGNYSKEFCGGTHLSSTGQIGLLKITNESAIAQGIRRIEAKSGIGALNYISEEEVLLDNIAANLKTPKSELIERINVQNKQLKQLSKSIEQLQFESIKNSIDSILSQSESVNGTKLISHTFENTDMNVLRKISDLLKQKSKSSIIVLGGTTMSNASILVTVSDDLIKKNYKANELINEIAPLINGKGGGRPNMAQAGSKEITKVKSAVKQANKLIKDKIK